MAKDQPKRRMCGTSEVHQRLCEKDPEFRAQRHAIHGQMVEMIRNGTAFRRVFKVKNLPKGKIGIIRIPVVVHVVYNTTDENVSIAQIKSQIKALNRDYRAINSDKKNIPRVWRGLVCDAQIEFVLATKDPKGARHPGIIRQKTSRTSFATDDAVKSSATGGADPWPSDKYLNIWVCSLGNGYLGYAQFPGGPVATDGVVILNTAFGTTGTATAPYNLGRTATHEVGHWLNLNHIWGDTNDCSGTDRVDDTPNALLPNYGKPAFPHVTCNNGPDGDMFVNYMDYVDDDTMIMFTPGQVARMHATLSGHRLTAGDTVFGKRGTATDHPPPRLKK
jgi:hypothetical protein